MELFLEFVMLRTQPYKECSSAHTHVLVYTRVKWEDQVSFCFAVVCDGLPSAVASMVQQGGYVRLIGLP